ncbi:MAG: FKBP-type peptidyl-prolyl cis-trans isomerase [Myxococcales bacterium]|nr:FKBP-type peptidyl-prolyl cis-trans isomerase [Myxococcales bacterium]
MKSPSQDDQSQKRVREGDVVAYRYVIRSESGQVLAASAEVVRYMQGGGDTFPKALSSKLLGRRHGESFTVTLSPEEAFGAQREPKQVALPRERFSELLTLMPGARVDTRTAEGEEASVWVVETREHDVVVDFEHPLAGQHLQFEIAILSIRVATEEERRVGRPSAPVPRDLPAVAGTTRLGQELAELRRSLTKTFKAEESAGGLHDNITRRSFGSSRRVQGMRSTHDELLGSLDALAAEVDDPDSLVDHERALLALLKEIAIHDRAESLLLQDSFGVDVGGEG